MNVSGLFVFRFKRILFKPHLQLRMRITSLENITFPKLSPDYRIRSYLKGDAASWVNIIKSSFGRNYLANEALNEILSSKEFDANGLLFITYHEQPVGTVCARVQSIKERKTGYVHMLGVIPAHQGKKLGRKLTLCALHYFKRKGFQDAILDTDDYRLPAIRTYVDLGFEPVYLERSHKKRWAKVFEEIKVTRKDSDFAA
jgi:mycothiol synthase